LSRLGDWREVGRRTGLAIVSGEDKKAFAGRDHVASLEAGIVHGSLVCRFRVLLVRLEGFLGSRSCLRDIFLRATTRVDYPLPPLIRRERSVGKTLHFFDAVHWRSQYGQDSGKDEAPRCHSSYPKDR
jgi:hypothetical protein